MKVVLKHGGRWLDFEHPLKVLMTENPEEVMPLLQEAEASGLFAAGFISYEAAPAFDAALKVKSTSGFPLLCLGLFKAPQVLESLENSQETEARVGVLNPSVTKKEFVDAVHEIKDQIAAGATYQVNYTYRLEGRFSGDAWAFFHQLVEGQRAEHAAFIKTEDFAICSASPELFFHFKDGCIISRPMKGTAKRGRTFSEDWQQAECLRISEKDRAENIMIVDMIRNDIGRVADAGSVETVSQYDVEKYPTVWQMTSTVQGKSSADIASTMKALFPCASITGAPKAKTMEIICALETTARNIYTGSMGFITPQGEACFNVAIRTALIDCRRNTLEFGVGGGIVWDSDAEAEYEETLTKARVLTGPRPDFQLLETMLWEPAQGIFLLDAHIQRLGKSAAYFDIPLDMHAIVQALEDTFQMLKESPHRIRLLIDRAGNSEIQTFPMETNGGTPDNGSVAGLCVAVAKEPVNSQDIFLFHKTTHRAAYEKAKADFSDFDDVILWNERGEITESCIANVVVRKGERLITPPVTCGLLAGTFRKYLLKAGEVEEGILTLDDLTDTDEIYLVNSVRKWQKAVLNRRR